ncbi:MAG: GNAT family N-acetyltransferase [Deferribacteres bacterium]|nr:GNAT family N-acetyltransferase [candidate division KSB1 bacterium]MCB9504117.1 GNAT family N-acetyltransferase [Deferribacteres bacterium]
MAIIVRKANLETEMPVLMDTLLRNRERYEDDDVFHERFEWAYLKNPHGKAIAWVVEDDKTGEVVGFTAGFPRKMSVNGKDSYAWNCADFSIDKKYRALGVAVKLRRAAKEGVDSGEIPFLYAHPNDRMAAVHERVGHHQIGLMKRYAALLRLDRKIMNYVKLPILGRFFGFFAQPIVHVALPQPKIRDKSLKFEFVEKQPFGDEFNAFYDEMRQHYPVSGYRDADYLTWRFIECPLYQVDTLKVYRDGKLRGYALVGSLFSMAQIADIVVAPEDGVLESLMAQVFKIYRKKGISTLSIKLHESNPLVADLAKFGFRERDDATSKVMAYANESNGLHKHVLDPNAWYMTVGDRDI